VGLTGGGASSHDCLTITSVAGTAVVPNAEGCHDATGGLVGGQYGYRWQATNWVFGVEGQGDWADLKGSNASLTAVIPYTNQTKINPIGLFTGQVGYAWNNASRVSDVHGDSIGCVSVGGFCTPCTLSGCRSAQD
jgi:outer membrane immunogenic protein